MISNKCSDWESVMEKRYSGEFYAIYDPKHIYYYWCINCNGLKIDSTCCEEFKNGTIPEIDRKHSYDFFKFLNIKIKGLTDTGEKV